ncbi:MAG TPA: FAD-dependent oxidoreductase [Streptosporangiaceae bacterium]|jgi:glycine/D-amino acid oxidase-like deaminating enzyme
MTQRAAVVIGAGIVGCLVARELAARDPEISITVLDRDAVGAGASRRSIGLHLPRGASARTRRMAAFSHAYYADLQRQHAGLPIHQIAATVINSGAGTGELPGGYLDLAAAAPAGSIPNPEVLLPEGSRAWRITGCHHTDVYQLAQAVAAELRPRVRFLEGVAATGLESRAGTVTVHGGSGEQLTADFAVLAPGPWLTAPAWHDRVAPLGLRVKKVAALHIERRPDPADEVVVFDSDDAFLLPLVHRGHWLFSYSCPEWDVDPDALTAGLAAADIRTARDCLRRYAPGLADACGGGRVFCDAYSPDREPLVRPLDDTGRLVFAGAANGSGYRLAPAIGSEAADLLYPSAGAPGKPLVPGTPRSEGVTGDHQYV